MVAEREMVGEGGNSGFEGKKRRRGKGGYRKGEKGKELCIFHRWSQGKIFIRRGMRGW